MTKRHYFFRAVAALGALVAACVLVATPALADPPWREEATARAKFIEEEGKAEAKAIEEEAKAHAKWIEERAKGLSEYEQELEKGEKRDTHVTPNRTRIMTV